MVHFVLFCLTGKPLEYVRIERNLHLSGVSVFLGRPYRDSAVLIAENFRESKANGAAAKTPSNLTLQCYNSPRRL